MCCSGQNVSICIKCSLPCWNKCLAQYFFYLYFFLFCVKIHWVVVTSDAGRCLWSSDRMSLCTTLICKNKNEIQEHNRPINFIISSTLYLNWLFCFVLTTMPLPVAVLLQLRMSWISELRFRFGADFCYFFGFGLCRLCVRWARLARARHKKGLSPMRNTSTCFQFDRPIVLFSFQNFVCAEWVCSVLAHGMGRKTGAGFDLSS